MSNSCVVVEQGIIDDIPETGVIAEEREPNPPPKLVELPTGFIVGPMEGVMVTSDTRLTGRHVGQDLWKRSGYNLSLASMRTKNLKNCRVG